jgi:hypothetical protein
MTDSFEIIQWPFVLGIQWSGYTHVL